MYVFLSAVAQASGFKIIKLNLLEWPLCSPDLNPMKTDGLMFDDLFIKIIANLALLSEFKTARKSGYDTIPDQFINHSIINMNNGLFHVINRNGNLTDCTGLQKKILFLLIIMHGYYRFDTHQYKYGVKNNK